MFEDEYSKHSHYYLIRDAEFNRIKNVWYYNKCLINVKYMWGIVDFPNKKPDNYWNYFSFGFRCATNKFR